MSEAYTVRNVTIDDVNAISLLVIHNNTKWFGNNRPKFDAKETLLKNYQTHRFLVEYNHKKHTPGKLVAYAEFRNYPGIGALRSSSWLEWLHTRYCMNLSISVQNSLFLNFFIYKAYHVDALHAVLCKVFYIENRLRYVIAVRMPSLAVTPHYDEDFDDLEKYANMYYPKEFDTGLNSNTQCLYIIQRNNILPPLTYRKALPEDNDDIIEIHEKEFPELRKVLGDYYIAEELMRQDVNAKKNALIVAEYENHRKETTTAGFMWLTTDLDITFYVQNYELQMFGNLLKPPNPSYPIEYQTLAIVSVEPKPQASLFTEDAMDDLNATTVIGGVQTNESGISVASLTKFRVSSVRGTIVGKNDASNQDKFYMREILFLKYQFIFDKLIKLRYYVNEQRQIINLAYNIRHRSSFKENMQRACNFFLLKYICVHREFTLERVYGFVCAMFSAFPDRDYCVMSIPNTGKALRSHFEALKYFLPVAKRPSKVSNLEDIYITHRSTIFGEISIYDFEKDDFDIIVNMTSEGDALYNNYLTRSPGSSFSYNSKVNTFADVENELIVIKLIMKDVLENSSSVFCVYTIRCGNSQKPAAENTPIGFVILRKFHYKDALHYHYHMPKDDDYLYNKRAEIICLKLHPLFFNCCDLLFRNLAMRTTYFDFFFICARHHNALSNDLKTMMMLIEPNIKRKYQYKMPEDRPVEGSQIKGLRVNDFQNDYLMIFRHKLAPPKWFGNDNRLVIIGFTPVAMALLRELVFLWNSQSHKNASSYTCLTRLQVTVISNPGTVEAEYDCLFSCPFCKDNNMCYLLRDNSSCYIRDILLRMDLRYWVHFVTGHVNYINREKKFVKINRSCEIAYDTLVLANYKKFVLCNEPTNDESHLPVNFIEVNARIDRLILYHKLQVLLQEVKHNYMVLIYGCNLSMYECIAFLLTHGLDAKHLVVVRPHITQGTEDEQKLKNPYFDHNLQTVLDEMLEDTDAKLYSNLNFSHWVQHTSTNFIVEVVFTKYISHEPITFDVDIFISFQEGQMGRKSKAWFVRSGINIIRNSIIVNKNFQTNDPNIYAVGNFIQMGEFVNYQYEYTNPRETAKMLMHILGIRTKENFEYKYSTPTYYQAILPLNYHMVKLIMPRRFLASVATGGPSCYLTTYHNYTFCRIGLTQSMFVNEIVVVTKQPISLDFLEHFCGKHETMLNNLKARYKAGTIKCFLEYLQQPWTELLTHENFSHLQSENHKILRPMLQAITTSQYSASDFLEINKNLLEQNLLEFVRQYRREFHHEFALPEDFTNEN